MFTMIIFGGAGILFLVMSLKVLTSTNYAACPTGIVEAQVGVVR